MEEKQTEQYLWVKFEEDEPVEIEATGCPNVSRFIQYAKQVLEVPVRAGRLLLQRHDGQILDPQDPPSVYSQGNTAYTPFLLTNLSKKRKIDQKEPSPHIKRLERWSQLNTILVQFEASAVQKSSGGKKKSKGSSVPPSSITWDLVFPVYEPLWKDYIQPVKDIPSEAMDTLHDYLKILSVTVGPLITTGKGSQRLHFIAPILVYVAKCFPPDDGVRLLIEENLVGNQVKAHGHFEFILKRRNKRICIVEAKKDKMDQGMVQSLLGMEVAAELDNLSTVYGIVTNYAQWCFLTSQDDLVLVDFDTLHFELEVVSKESLQRVAGKIFAVLSDD